MNDVRQEEGGDPACRIDRVCAECGRYRENGETTTCEHCGAAVDDGPGRTGTARRRDRDEEGRARNARPRDGLGRPLPRDASGVERQPEGVVRTPEQTVVEAQQLLDDGKPFHAHEVFEDAWKSGPESERSLWRGMAQLAVGLTHAARGNTKGARSLLLRGSEAIQPFADDKPHGLDITALRRWAERLAEEIPGHEQPPSARDIAPTLR